MPQKSGVRPLDRPSLPALLLVGAAALAFLLASGLGPETELNDEVFFLRNVELCRETRSVTLLPTFPTYLGLVPPTAALAHLFGPRLRVLRTLSLASAVVCAICVFATMGVLGCPGAPAAFAAALLLANPILFWTAHVFHTDLPCAALAALATLCFCLWLRSRSRRHLVAALAFSLWAAAVRQFGALLPVAAVITLAAGGRIATVSAREWAWFAGFVPALALAHLARALCTVGTSEALGPLLTRDLLHAVLPRTFAGLALLGFSLAPAVLGVPGGTIVRDRLYPACLALTACLAVAGSRTLGTWTFPYLPNVLHRDGLGPPLLVGVPEPLVPGWARGLLTAVTLVSTSVLLLQLARSLPGPGPGCADRSDEPGVRYCLVAAALTAGATVLAGRPYDRHVVGLLAWVVVWFVHENPVAARSRIAWALVGALGLASVVGTACSLSWNAVRATTASRLVSELRVGPLDLDGGFEWAQHLALRPGLRTPPPVLTGGDASAETTWWMEHLCGLKGYARHRPCLALSWSPLPGYTVTRVVPYPRPLGLPDGRILVLERSGCRRATAPAGATPSAGVPRRP